MLTERTVENVSSSSRTGTRRTCYIREVAEDPGRSDLGASLVIVGAMFLVSSVLVLVRLVALDHPRIAVTDAILAVIGCGGMACVSMAALVACETSL